VRPPSPKITRAKWTGGVALVVERLLCKLKALNSNPSSKATTIKKKFKNTVFAVDSQSTSISKATPICPDQC
jgi:hypothetical protein